MEKQIKHVVGVGYSYEVVLEHGKPVSVEDVLAAYKMLDEFIEVHRKYYEER